MQQSTKYLAVFIVTIKLVILGKRIIIFLLFSMCKRQMIPSFINSC